MDLRLLEVFCRVYAEGSFSRAARGLQLTQPTVSTHIRDLEDSLGTPLFNRLGREIQPTAAGRHLYTHVQDIVRLKRHASDAMASFLGRVEGVLTVGASSVPGECLLPGLMTGFHAAFPAVRARLRISDSAQTVEDVRGGRVEMGVVGVSAADPDLEAEPLTADALVLAIPVSADWLAGRGAGRRGRGTAGLRLTLSQLRALPLLLRESGSGTRTALERALLARGLTLEQFHVAAELGSLGAIKEAVQHGYGVSFISELAIRSEVEAGLMRAARVDGLAAIRRTYSIVLSRRRSLSPVTSAFLEYLRMHPPSPQPAGRRAHRPAGRSSPAT